MAGGWAGGVAIQMTGDGYPFLIQIFHDVMTFGLILSLVSLMFWLSEEHLYPTDDGDENEQPSDLPLLLR